MLINAKNCPQISGQKVHHSTLMVHLGSTKAIQHPMQKQFVREHGERGAKASNPRVVQREKKKVPGDAKQRSWWQYHIVEVLLNVTRTEGELMEKTL